MLILRRAVLAANVLAATVFAVGAGALARPLEPAESYDFHAQPYDAAVLRCDDPLALGQISFYFWRQQADFWHSDLQIQSFDSVSEVGFRTNGPDFIPRRYCSAKASFNDGRERTVKYNLINGGFIGLNTGLQFCVVGLDHNHAYSPACSAAGP